MKKALLLALLFAVASCATAQTTITIDDGTGHKLTQKAQSLGGVSKTIKWPGTNGTSGYLLSTDGANPAILSWVAPGSVTDAVITDPVLSSKNVIQGTAGVIDLTLKNPDDATLFLRFWDASGATLSYVSPDGAAHFTDFYSGNLVASSDLGLLTSDASGKVTLSAMTDGQLLIGSTATGNGALSTITPGTGIAITNSAGAITVATALDLTNSSQFAGTGFDANSWVYWDGTQLLDINGASNPYTLIGYDMSGLPAIMQVDLSSGSGMIVHHLEGDNGGTGNLTPYTQGDLLYYNGASHNDLDKLAIGSSGDVLTVVAGVPAWQPSSGSSLAPGTTTNSTLRWDGSAWVETTNVLSGLTGDLLSKTNIQAWGQLETGGPNNGVDGVVEFANAAGTHLGNLTNGTLTGNRTWNLPDATGTIALTTDIPSSGSYIKNQTSSQSSASFNITNATGTVAQISNTNTSGTATALTLSSTGTNGSPNQGLTFNVSGGSANNDVVGTSTNWKVTAAGAATFASVNENATTGDIRYASATNTFSSRAIGPTGNVLTVSGGLPVWAAPASLFSVAQEIDINSIGVTSTDALTLANTTAATVALNQWSPRLRLSGKGWKTNVTAASQPLDWYVENETSSGASSPASDLAFYTITNGGTAVEQLRMHMDNAGVAPTLFISGRNSSTQGAGGILQMGEVPTTTTGAGDCTIIGQPANGTNQFGGNFIWQAGLSTGNKSGQSLLFRSSFAGGSGATLTTAQQLMALTPSGTAASNPVATATFGKTSTVTGIINVCQSGASNASCGTATLAAGTVIVATAAVKTGDLIFVTDAGNGAANIGSLSVGNIVNATSFTITSTNPLDSSPVNWLIIRPN